MIEGNCGRSSVVERRLLPEVRGSIPLVCSMTSSSVGRASDYTSECLGFDSQVVNHPTPNRTRFPTENGKPAWCSGPEGIAKASAAA